MSKIYIFGTSGFGRETRDVAHALGLTSVFVAASAAERDLWRGDEDVVLEDDIPRVKGERFVIGIGDNNVRRKIATRHANDLAFVNLIHPSASFGKGQLEEIEQRCSGTIVCAGARFTNNIKVGDFCIFNLNATVGHDCVIESFVNVSPGANISGNVLIRERVWVGTGSAINQGDDTAKLEIGSGTVIGSGSVVVRDCDPDGVYVGIPAKKR